ncbi:MAG: tripartite tricarboxylate transporter substrate binding protein [Betaproteobacteria bacterium]|nr:tripartite tricarboxylate transporter substrate binding protein [Betaproteobacteria bacterium]
MKKAVWVLFGVLALALSAMSSSALAQDIYPSSPIRVVVGFAPGGAADTVGRLLAQKLSANMGTNVFVENKPGANSNIGAEFVAKSRPDGYTLLFNVPSNILSAAFGEKLGYDVLEDLAPVARVASGPMMLTVHPSVPANTAAEFIAYARANPGKLTYGSGGTGSITHLAPLLFLQANSLAALHVPYKGAGPAVLDLVGGRVQFAMLGMGPGVPLMKDKRIKALAITSLTRSLLLPDVPTLAETMPGFEVGTWYGMMAPAKTPPAIVSRLNGAIVKALQDPDMKSRLAQNNIEPLGSSPEDYGAYLRSELERWTKVIKSAGIKLE